MTRCAQKQMFLQLNVFAPNHQQHYFMLLFGHVLGSRIFHNDQVLDVLFEPQTNNACMQIEIML